MRVDLATDPWAARAAHEIEASSAAEWRSAVAGLPVGRFAAFVYVGDDPKPFPVQRFHGVDWPRSVVSNDGFLVIRTGLTGAGLALDQWQCLSEFPQHIAAYDAFISSDVRATIRGAVYPRPTLIKSEQQ